MFRGDPASREFIAFWLAGDRVLAGMNVNVWDVNEQVQRIIRERVPVDDRQLSDPDVPLERHAPLRAARAGDGAPLTAGRATRDTARSSGTPN
jgi:hypothetical protein